MLLPLEQDQREALQRILNAMGASANGTRRAFGIRYGVLKDYCERYGIHYIDNGLSGSVEPDWGQVREDWYLIPWTYSLRINLGIDSFTNTAARLRSLALHGTSSLDSQPVPTYKEFI